MIPEFELGQRIKFVDLLGHEAQGWGMDKIEFKVMQNYVGKTGKIIDIMVMDDVPEPYNQFLTVQFKDGYTLHDVNHYAFGPADPVEIAVLDFQKEREKRMKRELENDQ